tara:strand:- start:82449 stop:85121 length:2673 start_codon:yes stop_codon:yes gene_type:complete
MAIFNPEFFTNPTASLNTSFGIPNCVTNLGLNALRLLSGETLSTLFGTVEEGKSVAEGKIAGAVKELFTYKGYLSVDDDTGKLTISGFAENNLDLSFLAKLDAINRDLAAAEALINQGVDFVNEVLDCVGQFKDFLGGTEGATISSTAGGLGAGTTNTYVNNLAAAEQAITIQQITDAQEFIKACNDVQIRIGQVLNEQANRDAATEPEGPIFRMIYGPPVSKKGLFILSEDGLYYDSQVRKYNGKDIPSASDIGIVIDSESWDMKFPPNLGGKGTIVSLADVNEYVDTLFDINKIDNSDALKTYYDNDHFLEVLESQKQKQVLDTSAQITELYASGYANDSALIVNYRQSLYGILASYEEKINKRKKQIEVAVKASTEFGVSQTFALGTIPINDFSYLSSINLTISLEQQQRLSFEAGSVGETVLPIQPIFVRSVGSESSKFVVPFNVADVGKGAIITTGGSVSSTNVPTLSITDQIVPDKLFAAFNFLRAKGQKPDSDVFGSLNCATLGMKNNAQLIGRNPILFTSGLAIPYLGGMTTINNFSKEIRDYKSICRLPETVPFQNFMYNKAGGSFECWLHMPGYGTSSNTYERGERATLNLNATNAEWVDYNYYKILLANENLGGNVAAELSSVVTANGTDSVRGMLMGFSRDPAITFNEKVVGGPDTNIGLNAGGIEASATTASSCFFIAPTMSVNKNMATFTPQYDGCNSDNYAKMTIYDDVTVNGTKFSDVKNGFMHLAVTFDVSSNDCKVFLDSHLMATSSLTEVFGFPKYQAPAIPSFIVPPDSDASSFYYSENTVRQKEDTHYFDNGPANDGFFTPWMIGGGWTDGFPISPDTSAGGFMGTHHGYTSGLNGYVGSVKFYSKPLSNDEVATNYNAQKGFFKNIIT